jgi:hypothetical protein
MTIGDTVFIPEPKDGDAWVYGEFYGTVIDIVGTVAIVEDSDSDCWEIELDRLE